MKKFFIVWMILSIILSIFPVSLTAAENTLHFPCDTFEGIIEQENVSLYEIFEGDREAFYDDFTTLQRTGDGEAYAVFEIPYAESAVLTTYHLPAEAMDFTFLVSNDLTEWQSPVYTREVAEAEGKWTAYTYTFENLSGKAEEEPAPTATVSPTASPTPEATETPTQEPKPTAPPAPEPSAEATAEPSAIPEVKGAFDAYQAEIETPMYVRYLKVIWPENPTWWTPLVADLTVHCSDPVPQCIEIKTPDNWVIPMYDSVSYPICAVLLDQMGNPYPGELQGEVSCEQIPDLVLENDQVSLSAHDPDGAVIQICYRSKDFRLEAYKQVVLKKALLGDLNQDMMIDESDLDLALSYLGSTKEEKNWTSARMADINRDGIIDILDIAYIARNCHG